MLHACRLVPTDVGLIVECAEPLFSADLESITVIKFGSGGIAGVNVIMGDAERSALASSAADALAAEISELVYEYGVRHVVESYCEALGCPVEQLSASAAAEVKTAVRVAESAPDEMKPRIAAEAIITCAAHCMKPLMLTSLRLRSLVLESIMRSPRWGWAARVLLELAELTGSTEALALAAEAAARAAGCEIDATRIAGMEWVDAVRVAEGVLEECLS